MLIPVHGYLSTIESSIKFWMEVEQEGALPTLDITVATDQDGH